MSHAEGWGAKGGAERRNGPKQAPFGRHGFLCRRGRRRRRRAKVLPTPGTGQVRVWRSGQGGGAVRNAPGALSTRD